MNNIGANKPALLTMFPNFDRGRTAVVDSAAGVALELEKLTLVLADYSLGRQVV